GALPGCHARRRHSCGAGWERAKSSPWWIAMPGDPSMGPLPAGSPSGSAPQPWRVTTSSPMISSAWVDRFKVILQIIEHAGLLSEIRSVERVVPHQELYLWLRHWRSDAAARRRHRDLRLPL